MTHHLFISAVNRRALLSGVVAVAALLAGCASTVPATPERVVQQRANAYWQARLAGKPEQAYALSTPSYRALRNVEQFSRQVGSAAGIRAAEVHNVVCTPENCTARMALSVRPPLPGFDVGLTTTYVNETWVQENGQWWRHQAP